MRTVYLNLFMVAVTKVTSAHAIHSNIIDMHDCEALEHVHQNLILLSLGTQWALFPQPSL